MAIPAIIYLQHARPAGFIYLTPPHWALPVHHIYIFKHAPHLAIPAIIYLKHAPGLGDSGSSYIFKHAPHLAIPGINTFNTPDQCGSSYILNTPPLGASGSSYIFKHVTHFSIPAIIYLKHAPPPPHGAIPVYHTYLNTPLIWRFRPSYTLNMPPDWAIPVHHIHAPHLAIPAIIYLQHARPVGFIIYLKHPPNWALPVHHIYLNTPLIWRFRLSYIL